MRLLIALTLLCAAPAAAQTGETDGDRRLPTWEQSHTVEGNQTVRILRAFAYCSVRTRGAVAETLLAAAPGSDAEREAIRQIAGEGPNICLTRGGAMHFRGAAGIALFRGILAEFLYNRDNSGPRRYPPQSPAGPPAFAGGDAALGFAVAGCAVRAAPDRAHALVRFNHDSPGETRMLRALRPVLLNCLPADRSLHVTRRVIRALLAEALYHFSRENQAAGR